MNCRNSRATLESLRQPLETGKALIARVNHHVTYPARFQLVAAMNPCRCGYLGDPSRECTRAPKCAVDYQAKISGPLLDRFDLQVDVPPVSLSDLQNGPVGESSPAVLARVMRARETQLERGRGLNAHLDAQATEDLILLTPEAKTLLGQAAERLKLSARAYHRILRTARTIADLAGDAGEISAAIMAESLSYRHNWT